MFAEAFVSGESWVHRLDPRGRVVAAVALSLCVALLARIPAAGLAFAGAMGLAGAARLPLAALCRRLLPLNGFLALLWLALPLTSGGNALFHMGTLAVSSAGVNAALLMTLKANALLLILTALLTTMEFTQLGRALHGLRFPSRLTTLLLLTGRYISVLQAEYRQLRRAMRVRAFTPRTDAHTMRTLGYLVGMLLVRGLERSERVLHAMKCRGYTGDFPVADPFALAARDAWFGTLTIAALAALAAVEFI